MFISQAIYVVKENPATVNRGQKSGRVRCRDQLQHVAMLLGRTAWRHVGGAPPTDRGEQSADPPPSTQQADGDLLVATTCTPTYPGS